MSYPQITDYQDAVQDPRNSFSDPELKNGTVALNPLGLPAPMSGGFVLTYTVEVGSKKYAVRCFHKEVPQAQARYAQISNKLRALSSPYFVNFDFQTKGILIRGAHYPIVKMDWVAGETLGLFLDRWSKSAPVLASLRQGFSNLSDYLERSGIAHGDIQNENVIISGNAPRLIDYDGMFVPGMVEGQGTEIGQRNFQHPKRTTKQFGPAMDRFSFIMLDISLEALQADASLHGKYREGGQAILFKANDFSDPSTSEIFQVLKANPALKNSVQKFEAICSSPVESVPSLSDYIVGKNIPVVTLPPVGSTSKPKTAPTYIGAFDVVAATDFYATLARVGDKIELVGKIVSVKEGIGRRGRGRGKPYVFLNLGKWNEDSVKITIWSEGLGNMSTRPNSSWEGKWISVTGLVEPPYNGKHYGKSYRNVGITVTSDSEIVHLKEHEAKFRLGAKGAQVTAGTSRTSNADILRTIGGKTKTPNPLRGTSVRSSPTKPATKNQSILQGIQAGASQPNQPTARTPAARHPTPLSSPGFLSRVPFWVWIILGIVLLSWLSRRH